MTWLANAAKTLPAGVKSTLRVVRMSRSASSDLSRSLIVWLSHGAETNRHHGEERFDLSQADVFHVASIPHRAHDILSQSRTTIMSANDIMAR